MRKKSLLLSVMAAMLLTVPVLAGEGYEKCTAGTQECLDKMTSHMKTKGWVGIEMEQDETTGIPTVTRVVPDSPAEKAGLKAGDRLVAMNGIKMGEEQHSALKAAWETMKPGKKVTYTVARGEYKKDVTVELGVLPEEVLAAWVGRHMLDHAAVDVAQN
jgi:C-terminal processing protease CtpA/Prc